jgi:hypothetical protein
MIALITPTGGRPIQINLCLQWMKRQTYPGKVAWIIIDDCEPRTTDIIPENFRDNWTIIKYYPVPFWSSGQNTQARNLSAGIQTLLANYKREEIEAIFIIEDDDYYKPVYLERMKERLTGVDIVGETNTIYYNVYYRTYVTNGNTIHASLFQTAFTVNAIPVLESCYWHKFIDCQIWAKIQNKNLFNHGENLAIGMKGMPGRYGIGAGHSRWASARTDVNLNYLKSLIGEDAKLYEGFNGYYRVSQNPFFAKRSL